MVCHRIRQLYATSGAERMSSLHLRCTCRGDYNVAQLAVCFPSGGFRMKRLLISCALALPIVTLTAGPAVAEVKTREKSQVKLEGMFGRVMSMFGGKAAKEGIVATAAVKGNRKATMNDSTGQIIDLSEEKVYELDLKKKTYQVTTFDEIRRQMKEAKEKAEKEAREQSKEETKESQPQKA